MRRRDFIILSGGAAIGLSLSGQAQPTKLPRIGILLVGNREPFRSVFREGLRDLGYIEQQNISLEVRSSEGKPNVLWLQNWSG